MVSCKIAGENIIISNIIYKIIQKKENSYYICFRYVVFDMWRTRDLLKEYFKKNIKYLFHIFFFLFDHISYDIKISLIIIYALYFIFKIKKYEFVRSVKK